MPMIKSKLKTCAGCNLPKIIWKSHGKDKYCKECWYSMEKPKSIKPISDKKKVQLDEYSKKRVLYLALHPNCEAKLVGCTSIATDIHHKAGRIEDNLIKVSNFLAVCRNCHHWIEKNPVEAKELGFSESRLNQ